MMVGGIAAGAAVRTFPFRVFSFPKEIVPQVYETEWMTTYLRTISGVQWFLAHNSPMYFKEISVEGTKLLFADFGLLRDSSSPLLT